ncbi:MAG TPA: WXG100 family type VII secretion target [Actinospica sp.]|jgi:hypothetical protein|nr:WXG100 family type VII secretion target [Actinospica sp.]
MGGFNQQAVNTNGGVAWAKQVAQTMDPGAIDSQIQGYQSAVSSLANVQSTLQNVKNNLAASWSGDAAEQAQQSFQTSINHTQMTQETISSSVIPALQSAKAAQQQYVTTMSSVPDEKPVPSNSIVDDVESWFGAETPAQKAQSHNTAARSQAADALNTLSDSYENSANQLNSVGSSEGTLNEKGDQGAYSLGSVASSSGDGSASAYRSSVNNGGATGTAGYVPSSPSGTVNPGSNPSTTLAGTSPTQTVSPTPDPIWGTGNPTNTTPTPEPDPIWGTTDPIETGPGGSSYNKGGLITDEPEEGRMNGLSENGLGEENLGRGSGSRAGVFDETGMSDGELNGGTGSGMRGRTSSGDGSSLIGEEEGAGGAAGEGAGSENGMSRGMGRGGAGMGGDEEDLGSSRYSRGRYLGVEDEEDSRSMSPVRSVYEDATDADGNKVNMMGPGRRGMADGDDEEDERGKRASYLKEDEFWNNAQRIVPPVIQ